MLGTIVLHSYAGITRIRFLGSASVTKPSQPDLTPSTPWFFCIIHPECRVCQHLLYAFFTERLINRPTTENATRTAKVRVFESALNAVGTKDAGMRIRFKMLKLRGKFLGP